MGNDLKRRPQVVIVGAGFGGLSAAQALKDAPVDVTLIDRHNYHLFQPLLYQVATASLSPADIAQPIRSILKAQANARVLLGVVTGIDAESKRVFLSDGAAIDYDTLVLATGARHSYFGKDQWAAHAPGIKSIDDATRVRAKILLAFERAEVESDPERRHALLTFVIVGGGPTGVELAGAIAELARNSITRDFRSITPRCAHIILAEAGKRLLPALSQSSSEETRRALERLGVEVRLETPVGDISAQSVLLDDKRIAAKTVIWAAGVRATQAGEWLKAATDMAGRVIVNADFSVPGVKDVFVIGDAASFRYGMGQALPAVAPAAKQAGAYVARRILNRDDETPPFVYADYGSMATIGRKNAVADIRGLRLRGFIGWLSWSLIHIYFLIGFRSRLSVAASWAWSYLTYQRGVRLITGSGAGAEHQMDEAA